MKMNESTFVDMLCEKLEDKLDGLTVSKMENLIYKVIVNEDLEFEYIKDADDFAEVTVKSGLLLVILARD